MKQQKEFLKLRESGQLYLHLVNVHNKERTQKYVFWKLKKYFYINSGSFIQYVLKVMLEILVNVLIKHIKFTLYWGQGGKEWRGEWFCFQASLFRLMTKAWNNSSKRIHTSLWDGFGDWINYPSHETTCSYLLNTFT